jgi:DNA polymerase-3 subunit delta
VPAFKPAYLILGDDHGRISERRAKLRALAEADAGASGVEVLEGDACTADNVEAALTTMTFAMGRRFVIADGVERWKDADVEQVAAAMKGMDGETLTIALFGREEGRNKVADGPAQGGRAGGGQISEESGVKPWELPRWVAARARELDLELDQGAPKALIAQVGERQQRLLRELEKLALEHGAGADPHRRRGRGVQRLLRRAQGVDARRHHPRRRRAGRRSGRSSSCAARASASPGCCTRSSAG